MKIIEVFSGMVIHLKKNETIIVLSKDRSRYVLFATGLSYTVLEKESYLTINGDFYEYKPRGVLLFTNTTNQSLSFEVVMRNI